MFKVVYILPGIAVIKSPKSKRQLSQNDKNALVLAFEGFVIYITIAQHPNRTIYQKNKKTNEQKPPKQRRKPYA